MNRFIEKIKKLTPSILPFVFGFVLIFIPIIAGAEEPAQQLGFFQRLFGRVGDTVADVLLFIPGWLSIVILQIANLLLSLAGLLLNFIVKYTIVNMAHNIGAAGINIEGPWSTIRDVVNMGFIFILLYAGIMTIIGKEKDTKRVIVNVVVAAILINFSMFFTKLVIDAANLIAVFFYDAIAPGATADVYTRGLSNSLMDPLRITTLAKDVGMLDGTTAIVVGVMGTIFVLIATFVLLAMCVMLVIRFVVLIFTIILSPIAFLSAVLPQTEKYRKQWWDALSGQAFFAPIFFLMIWIVIAVSRGLVITSSEGGALGAVISGSFVEEGRGIGTNIGSMEASIGLVFNFVVIIALLIAAMIISKEWANKAGPTITGMTKWATGAAGGATFGLAGRVGRGTIGAYGSRLADSEELKEMAENKDGKYNRRQQMRARLNLMAGQKLQKQSFDVRGTGLGGTLDAGKAQGKGGFAQKLKDDAKAKKEFADSLKPSAIVIDEAEREVKRHAEGTEERKAAQDRLDALKGVNKEEMEKREKEALKNDPVVKTKKEIEEEEKKLKKQEEEIERETKEKEDEIAKTIIPQMKARREEALKLFKEQKAGELRIAKEEFNQMRDASETRAKEIKSAHRKGGDPDGEFKTIDSAEQRRKNVESDYQRDSRVFGKGETENQGWNKILYIPKANKQAAAEIKKTKKSAKELVDEALKATGETTGEKKEDGKDDKEETTKESPKA